MSDPIAEYLKELRSALAGRGADPAVIQDAEFDAAEFLAGASDAGTDIAEAVKEFGAPDEVAAAYLENEEIVRRSLQVEEAEPQPVFSRPSPRTWASIAYLMLSLATGIAYFVTAVVGISLSASLAVFIIGIPVFLVFVGVVRTVSLVEGRIIETLLGIRMPRRPLLAPVGPWLTRFKHWLKDRRTWTSMVYMVIQLPLGIAYFGGLVAGFAMSGWFVVGPWAQTFAGVPFIQDVNGGEFFLAGWAVPLATIAGVLGLFLLFALARFVGKWHARYAKWMLVGSLGKDRPQAR